MSQAIECSRCHKNPSYTTCTMCEELGDKVALCGGCFSPHYRLMHGYDPNTGKRIAPLPFKREFTVSTAENHQPKITFVAKGMLKRWREIAPPTRKARKQRFPRTKKPAPAEKRLVRDWIAEHLK